MIDIIGDKYGRWTVLGETDRASGKRNFKCSCSCGKSRIVNMSDLRSGKSKSCGCYNKDVHTTRLTKHGMYNTPTYISWAAIKRRCLNKSNPSYKDYGEAGIGMCERWHKFENFYEDMGGRPVGTSIDRINNNWGYEPSNCRWATASQQQNNTSRNKRITHNGETLTLSQWSEKLDIKYTTLWCRFFKSKWKTSKALTTGVREYKQSQTLA